jgi:phenylalanine-4-hydroxylase
MFTEFVKVKKLISSKNLGTIELSTGIQISGIFTNVLEDDGKPIYIQTTGKTALASRDKELIGHGVEYHSEGFGSPIGKLEGINLAIEDMSPTDLDVYGICEGEKISLLFEGGVKVEGEIITGIRDLQGKIILISFENCTVTYKDEILFQPEWGVYDMAVGKEIVSAFAGPASTESFEDVFKISENKTHKITYSNDELNLHKLYKKVRNLRENQHFEIQELTVIYEEANQKYQNEWLLLLEMYELLFETDSSLKETIHQDLIALKEQKKYSKLITDGLRLIKIQRQLT